VTVFKGIKGLVASGPGKTKTPDIKKLRPEGAVHIDAGNLKPGSSNLKVAAGSPKKISKGSVSVGAKIRPEGTIKRDSASVVKP
jgi:hypothetical protein